MAQAREKVNYFKSVRAFFSEVMEEMKKVVWPTREVLIQSTLLVLAVIVILSTFMALADMGLNFFFDYGLDNLKKYI